MSTDQNNSAEPRFDPLSTSGNPQADSDPTLAALVRELEADAFAQQPAVVRGRSLEDRIFASTQHIVERRADVVMTIGRTSRWRVWTSMAAAAALGLGTLLMLRPATVTDTGTLAGGSGELTSGEVELVLAAVTLLDEPLAGVEDLAADARRLHELVASPASGMGTEESPDSMESQS